MADVWLACDRRVTVAFASAWPQVAPTNPTQWGRLKQAVGHLKTRQQSEQTLPPPAEGFAPPPSRASVAARGGAARQTLEPRSLKTCGKNAFMDFVYQVAARNRRAAGVQPPRDRNVPAL